MEWSLPSHWIACCFNGWFGPSMVHARNSQRWIFVIAGFDKRILCSSVVVRQTRCWTGRSVLSSGRKAGIVWEVGEGAGRGGDAGSRRFVWQFFSQAVSELNCCLSSVRWWRGRKGSLFLWLWSQRAKYSQTKTAAEVQTSWSPQLWMSPVEEVGRTDCRVVVKCNTSWNTYNGTWFNKLYGSLPVWLNFGIFTPEIRHLPTVNMEHCV